MQVDSFQKASEAVSKVAPAIYMEREMIAKAGEASVSETACGGLPRGQGFPEARRCSCPTCQSHSGQKMLMYVDQQG